MEGVIPIRRICFVTTIPATLKIFVLETAKYLHQHKGIDVTFVCDYDPDFAESLPAYIHYMPIPMKRGVSFSGAFSLLKMLRFFHENKFDLVQYATPNAAFYASVASFMSATAKRLYCQWGIRYIGMSGFMRQVFKLLEKAVCLLSTDIRAVSRKNLAFALSEGLYKARKAKVIGEGGTIGVDLERFDITSKESYREEIRRQYKAGDAFVFGFVGRLSRDKGANELLAAFRRINRSNPDTRLFVVGPMEADSGVDKQLLDWALQDGNVIFTGLIDQGSLVKYYAAFDCYVHPTYREGFGMVLQEAGAMGNAIITTDIPGASEVMEPEKSCLLAKARDTESLCLTMERVISDGQLCARLGQGARERTQVYFDRKIMLENQLKDYELLLELNRSAEKGR